MENNNDINEIPQDPENTVPEMPKAPEKKKKEKKKKEKLPRKEKRRRWKEAKKAKRAELKEYYRYAPGRKRIWNLYLKKPLFALLITALLVNLIVSYSGIIFERFFTPALTKTVDQLRNSPVTPEEEKTILELAPIDEKGAAKIDAAKPTGKDDTWTICYYIIGSNVEDFDENDLSEIYNYESSAVREQVTADLKSERASEFQRFKSELEENGLELPSYFYNPVTPVASSTYVTDDVIVAGREGFGSQVFAGATSGDWSDKINIVIQTGGATHWSNQRINPNRTQRFNYYNGVLKEIDNMPVQKASEPETLADFLRFCKENYPADHQMLIFWDHGGGPFGYGHDSIYGQTLSLKDIRSALESVYDPDSEKRAFDIIGFDCCLMSTLEVTHALDGFADYYCLSEETEPAPGWDHNAWLTKLTEEPGMSPAKICRTISDSFVTSQLGKYLHLPIVNLDITTSVIDARKATELYDAYCDLAKAQLKDSVNDPDVLAEIARCANRSTHYAGEYHNVFSTIDLGNYIDVMVESYPDECGKIRKLMEDTVLYHRENGALSDSTGIAVYFPYDINNLTGLMYFLDYIYNISEDENITALYYYKQAGCLPGDLAEYVKTLTGKEPPKLDVAPFRAFSRTEPEFNSDGFLLPVSEELQHMIAKYELEVGSYDEDMNTLTYYGREDELYLDGEGHLASDFDGTWICLNNVPLYIEIVSSSPSAVEYRAHINYNSLYEAYLIISRSRDTDELTITGVRKVYDEAENYMINSHSIEELAKGSRITPIYTVYDFNANTLRTENGKTVKFNNRTDLQLKTLPSGNYISTAVITDHRGDSYYSPALSSTLKGGTMQDWKVESRFIGRNY